VSEPNALVKCGAKQLSAPDGGTEVSSLLNEVTKGNGREFCGFHFNPPCVVNVHFSHHHK